MLTAWRCSNCGEVELRTELSEEPPICTNVHVYPGSLAEGAAFSLARWERIGAVELHDATPTATDAASV